VLLLKIQAPWFPAPCQLVNSERRFVGPWFSETSAIVDRLTKRNMPEDLTEFLVATVIVIIIIIIIVVVVSINNLQSSTDLRYGCSILQRTSRLLVHLSAFYYPLTELQFHLFQTSMQ